MSRTLVLGGVRSGKSRYAEALLRGRAGVTYVAPGPVPDGSDPEWSARIAAHRQRRPGGWVTLETADLVGAIEQARGPVLVDCLGTWLTRLVDDLDGWERPRETSAALAAPVQQLVRAWRASAVDLVAVTNEVGLGVVPATASGRLFRDELGRLNALLSAASDRVALVVAGRVLDLGGAPLIED